MDFTDLNFSSATLSYSGAADQGTVTVGDGQRNPGLRGTVAPYYATLHTSYFFMPFALTRPI